MTPDEISVVHPLAFGMESRLFSVRSRKWTEDRTELFCIRTLTSYIHNNMLQVTLIGILTKNKNAGILKTSDLENGKGGLRWVIWPNPNPDL